MGGKEWISVQTKKPISSAEDDLVLAEDRDGVGAVGALAEAPVEQRGDHCQTRPAVHAREDVVLPSHRHGNEAIRQVRRW